MHRAFCSFNDDEYEALEAKAKKLGMSTSKLIEYATTLFLDMPRTETPNVKEIRKKIEKYLEKVKDEIERRGLQIFGDAYESDVSLFSPGMKAGYVTEISIMVEKVV